jgi:DNA-binding MurR/RpiR family transcriptional regulator
MLERIKASIPALPPAEQRVAKLLLADPRSFATLPVSELADRAHVSKPTVVRFCRSVGYDGLADFKLKLAGTVNEGVPFVHRAVDEDDKPGDLIVKVVDNAVAAMLKYRNDATGHAFEQAIEALTAAGLGFLGLGAQPPMPEWGALIANGRLYVLDQWWVAAAPGAAIFLVSLAFNLLGDGLRDALDPKAAK